MKIAITFQQKYKHKDIAHPVNKYINDRSFAVFQGNDWEEALSKAHEVLQGNYAFDYLYEDENGLDEDFQQQIRDFELVEICLGT